MTHRIAPVMFAIALLAGATLSAQRTGVRRVQPPTPGVNFAEPWRPGATSETKIVGSVIDIRQAPIAYARVQLRNLITGQIADEKQTDANGEYDFSVEDPGQYVVEMARVDGYVVALSNAGSLARYETLRTVVQLPGRWDASRGSIFITPNASWYLGISAATTMTAATLSLAAEQSLSTIEAGESVSPQ